MISFFVSIRYRNSKMINHDHRSRGLNVSIQPNSHSTLHLPRVRETDSGNYTCAPQNFRPASTLVHIIDVDSDSAAAAIHTEGEGVARQANVAAQPPLPSVGHYCIMMALLAQSTSTTTTIAFNLLSHTGDAIYRYFQRKCFAEKTIISRPVCI